MDKETFEAYVRVQKSGATNMFDLNAVWALSHGRVTRDDILDIMSNYDKYADQWPEVLDDGE